jgi:hypothetical protein
MAINTHRGRIIHIYGHKMFFCVHLNILSFLKKTSQLDFRLCCICKNTVYLDATIGEFVTVKKVKFMGGGPE